MQHRKLQSLQSSVNTEAMSQQEQLMCKRSRHHNNDMIIKIYFYKYDISFGYEGIWLVHMSYLGRALKWFIGHRGLYFLKINECGGLRSLLFS